MTPTELYIFWYALNSRAVKSFYIRHWVYVFQKSIELLSYNYRMFSFYIPIVKCGPVTTCGSNFLFLISAMTQAYFCRDDSMIGRHSFKREERFSVQNANCPFLAIYTSELLGLGEIHNLILNYIDDYV